MATNGNRLKPLADAADVRSKRRDAKQAAFLGALAAGATINAACRAAGIDPKTQRRWRADNPGFAVEFRTAFDTGTDTIVDECYRRAVPGVERPLWYAGKPLIDPATGKQYIVREYSDTLLMFLLKSRDPATYDDRVRAEKIFRKWRKADAKGDGAAVAAADVVELLTRLASQKQATAEPLKH